MIFLLMLAGHDTTANLIGSSALALMEHPDQAERLRAEPELMPSGGRGAAPLHHARPVRRRSHPPR